VGLQIGSVQQQEGGFGVLAGERFADELVHLRDRFGQILRQGPALL
jgi:hypothetical protein